MKNLIAFIAIAALMSSCAKPFYLGRVPQLQFTYPNANITPMGQVRGEAKKTKFLGIPYVTSALQQAAYQDALAKQPGSDVLINADLYVLNQNFIIVKTIKYIVDGTAAKQEVGKQDINND